MSTWYIFGIFDEYHRLCIFWGSNNRKMIGLPHWSLIHAEKIKDKRDFFLFSEDVINGFWAIGIREHTHKPNCSFVTTDTVLIGDARKKSSQHQIQYFIIILPRQGGSPNTKSELGVKGIFWPNNCFVPLLKSNVKGKPICCKRAKKKEKWRINGRPRKVCNK